MKKYFYYVVYEVRTDDLTIIGSVEMETNRPITHGEDLVWIAKDIKRKNELPRTPTITNFLLLRTEEVPA